MNFNIQSFCTETKEIMAVLGWVLTLTKVAIPKNLSGLESKKVLHSDVIEKNELTDYVLKKVAEEKW